MARKLSYDDKDVHPGQRSRQLLLADLKRMDEGTLGLTDQQKNQASDAAKTATAQQAGALQKNVARDSMQTGAPYSGQATQAQHNIAQAAATSAAQTNASVDDMSSRLAEARRNEVLARLDKQRAINRANATKGLQLGGQAVEAAGSAMSAGGMGM